MLSALEQFFDANWNGIPEQSIKRNIVVATISETAILWKMNLKLLVVSKESIAEEAIANTLHGLISIVDGSGEVMPLGPIGKLNDSKKILAYLLGKRAAVTLGLCQSSSATAEQIANTLGMDVQRVREHLSRAKGKYFDKTKDGYEIPIPRIPSVCEEIKQ